jgi:hypothetical protein
MRDIIWALRWHDRIVIGREGHVSLRQRGLFTNAKLAFARIRPCGGPKSAPETHMVPRYARPR